MILQVIPSLDDLIHKCNNSLKTVACINQLTIIYYLILTVLFLVFTKSVLQNI